MIEQRSQARFPVFIIGTRAQLIKVAPVIAACERNGLAIAVLMTGQHRETMQDLIEEFGIHTTPLVPEQVTERATVFSLLKWLPSAYLSLCRTLQTLRKIHPELDVVVHGDTLSTVLGAIAGVRCDARVVHLESGLSSGWLFDPFPEELSRRLVFRMTDVAMCPNALAADHMRRRYRCNVIATGGNTILDAVAMVRAVSVPRNSEPHYLLASLHRFQNIYAPKRLRELVSLLESLADRYPIYFVLHPATRKRLVKENLLDRLAAVPGITLSPRLGYGDFLRLAARASCVLTDGGSNQEELAALGVPTIVMRKATERLDGLGANAIMEADIAGGVQSFVFNKGFLDLARVPTELEEDGPSGRIAKFLSQASSASDTIDKQSCTGNSMRDTNPKF